MGCTNALIAIRKIILRLIYSCSTRKTKSFHVLWINYFCLAQPCISTSRIIIILLFLIDIIQHSLLNFSVEKLSCSHMHVWGHYQSRTVMCLTTRNNSTANSLANQATLQAAELLLHKIQGTRWRARQNIQSRLLQTTTFWLFLYSNDDIAQKLLGRTIFDSYTWRF